MLCAYHIGQAYENHLDIVRHIDREVEKRKWWRYSRKSQILNIHHINMQLFILMEKEKLPYIHNFQKYTCIYQSYSTSNVQKNIL